VLPEIIASITFQPLVKYLFNSEPIKVVMLGGVSMIVAAALVTLVDDVAAHDHAKPVAGGH
ncbi:MAG TPA: MFS transporter, partial [Acidobacteriota bacterium]|nr:MFS transporter [Acidobacteriota bacterium]